MYNSLYTFISFWFLLYEYDIQSGINQNPGTETLQKNPFLTKKEKTIKNRIQNADKQRYTNLITKGIKALFKCFKRRLLL